MIVALTAPKGAPDTAPDAHGTRIVVRLAQPENAPECNVVGVQVNVIDVKLVHCAKA